MKLLRLTLLIGCVLAAQSLWAASILIYGPSMSDTTPNEQTIAEDAGHTVTVVDESQWAAMDAGDFSSYDAIVLGDNHCEGTFADFAAVDANKEVWSPVVTGNFVLNTADPIYHNDPSGPGISEAGTFVRNSINYAAAGSGTGLYVSLGCYADGDGTVNFLSEFGTFSYLDESYDEVTILQPSHPVFDGLTDSDMSGWGDTGHSLLEQIPPDFVAIAQDSVSSLPVVVIRGAVVAGADVPALSPLAMALLAASLGLLALFALRLR